jgi:hypothetical protein
MKADMEAVPVHLVGTDIQIGPQDNTVTEHEPEHFVFYTRVIPPFSGSPEPGVEGSGAWYEQVVNLDPLRKSVSIYFPDGPAILCHSEAQASDSSNLTTGTPFPQGAYFPAGSSMSADGTGPVWVVNPGTTAVRVTIVQNRWGV